MHNYCLCTEVRRYCHLLASESSAGEHPQYGIGSLCDMLHGVPH